MYTLYLEWVGYSFNLLSGTSISAGRSAHTTSFGRGFVGDVGDIRSEFSLVSESESHTL